jgi:hypothetical protein
MRALIVTTGMLAALALPAGAQTQAQPGLEIQAKKPLPTGKYAVDLDTDTALGRDVRRLVMERLAKLGHQVGFSGGHVMKLQVNQTRNFAGGLKTEDVLVPPRPAPSPGSDRLDVRPPMPDRPVQDMGRAPVAGETLRLTLTLRAAGSGEVIWVAYAACPYSEGRALRAGAKMVDTIFADPNRSRRGKVECPP